jgi:hypothetical protein
MRTQASAGSGKRECGSAARDPACLRGRASRLRRGRVSDESEVDSEHPVGWQPLLGAEFTAS